ncbi:MAG: bifunctional alpha,alpha-trehalose-phosphate synthase (UDP-forming)/trehalose-phosphatase [Myxococcota bacterium]
MLRVLSATYRPRIPLPVPGAVEVSCGPLPDEAAHFQLFCDEVLWPVFHYLLDRVPLDHAQWELYQEVNRRAADAVASRYQRGDLIWVHEHALLLLPALVRERIPEARVGLSLSIPFPSSEIFRVLPWRAEVLTGMLGADLVALQTAEHVRHLASAVKHVLGVEADVDRVVVEGREIHLAAFPASVDAARWQALARDPAVQEESREWRGSADVQVLLGIDALDESRTIARRLLALDHLLRTAPSLAGRFHLVQVATPGPPSQDAGCRVQVRELTRRLRDAFSRRTWSPLTLVETSPSERELAALYHAADILLVTPPRDGMNLRAKEYVATRVHGDGVVVLSEFSGAVPELRGALLCNPYAVTSLARTMGHAVALPVPERRERMARMRERVTDHDVTMWAASLVDNLRRKPPGGRPRARLPSLAPEVETLRQALRHAATLLLMLDYDGTLMPFAAAPGLAAPDGELLDLLHALSLRARTHVHVVSGRTRESLDAWLGHLPIGLHAEHGFWSRGDANAAWVPLKDPATSWKGPVMEVLQHFTAATPNTFIEEKTGSLAWHYRQAEQRYAQLQVQQLRLRVQELTGTMPVELLQADKVVEVRLRGVHKGAVVSPLLQRHGDPPGVAAFGDDTTDEDMFAALPQHGLSVHVGPKPSQARFTLADPHAVRALLKSIL